MWHSAFLGSTCGTQRFFVWFSWHSAWMMAETRLSLFWASCHFGSAQLWCCCNSGIWSTWSRGSHVEPEAHAFSGPWVNKEKHEDPTVEFSWAWSWVRGVILGRNKGRIQCLTKIAKSYDENIVNSCFIPWWGVLNCDPSYEQVKSSSIPCCFRFLLSLSLSLSLLVSLIWYHHHIMFIIRENLWFSLSLLLMSVRETVWFSQNEYLTPFFLPFLKFLSDLIYLFITRTTKQPESFC